MIIKPLCLPHEFEIYFRSRNKNQFTSLFNRNLSANPDMEIDTYDFSSFHFAAFSDDEMVASCRVINGGFYGYKQNEEISKIIHQLTNRTIEKKKLQILSFVESKEEIEILNFLRTLEKKNYSYSELSRLQKIKDSDEKLIMNYIMCYALAYNRYHKINFCFFDAKKAHSLYYERYFRCKKLFDHIKLYPVKDAEPRFIMQATIADRSVKKNAIADKIVDKFKKEGKPCTIKLKEIK